MAHWEARRWDWVSGVLSPSPALRATENGADPLPSPLDLGLGLLSGMSTPASLSDTKKAHAPTPARKARSRSPRLPCGLPGSPCRTPSPLPAFSCGASPGLADAPGGRLSSAGPA